MVALYETLRPKDFHEVIGFSDTIRRLEKLNETLGFQGQVFWFSGLSGTGKTTIARIIASKVADPCQTEEIDAQNVTVDKLREWESLCRIKPMFGDSYALIVNESHNLSTKAVSLLQTVLESPHVQRNSTWIFTTTDRGQQRLFDTKFDALPMLSRALQFELVPDEPTLRAMARRLFEIACTLGLGSKALHEFEQLLVDCHGNFRAALQSVASGSML